MAIVCQNKGIPNHGQLAIFLVLQLISLFVHQQFNLWSTRKSGCCSDGLFRPHHGLQHQDGLTVHLTCSAQHGPVEQEHPTCEQLATTKWLLDTVGHITRDYYREVCWLLHLNHNPRTHTHPVLLKSYLLSQSRLSCSGQQVKHCINYSMINTFVLYFGAVVENWRSKFRFKHGRKLEGDRTAKPLK